jgi:adenylate kinase
LEATHELLMNRVVFRKIDPVTQETYHVPNPDAEVSAMHEHMEPKDKEVASRLVERHDDSEENVRNRLKFWDQFYKELRRSYPDVSMTISGEGEAANIATQCIDFLKAHTRSAHVV